MNLLGVLQLALATEVSFTVEGGKIAATPKEHLTPKLREGIRENREELLRHLLLAEEHELYALLCEVAAHGVDLKVKNGRLVAKPMEALGSDILGRLKPHKATVVTMLEDWALRKTGVIQCERQVVDVAREVLA